MKHNRGKKWFYAMGQRAAACGIPFQKAFLWPAHNVMPTHAWYAYCEGYHGEPMGHTNATLKRRTSVFQISPTHRRMVNSSPNFQQIPRDNRPAWLPKTPEEWMTAHHVIKSHFDRDKDPQPYQKAFMETVLGKPYEHPEPESERDRDIRERAERMPPSIRRTFLRVMKKKD